MSMGGAVDTVLYPGSGGAKQSFKKECDINNILALYAKTGLLTPVTKRSPAFVDVSFVGDYRQAVENVRIADEMFMELPSAVRSEFDNDAAEFLDFCTNPDNEDEMRDMGLLPPLDVEDVEEPGPSGPGDPEPKAPDPPDGD